MKTVNKQSGISLIEVLVVMVLLLVGIFSVVRLFPPGFLINKQTESFTLAGRLAKQEQDRFVNNVPSLMDAIVPVVPVAIASPPGYAFKVDTDSTPDDLGEAPPNALGVDSYYYSNINKPRRIIGESVRIPIPSPTSAGQGSVYVLSSGPIFNTNWYVPPTAPLGSNPDSIFIRGAPFNRRVDSNTNVDISDELGSSAYAIDYESAQVAFSRSNFDRSFLITYAYLDTNNRTQTILDEKIVVPKGSFGWQPLTGNSGRPLAPDSDTCARAFVRLLLGDLWSFQRPPDFANDPYEYKLLSPNDGAFANVGVLLFNPLGHNFTEFTAGSPQPLTARIDYDMLDWHIIREDRPMPGAPPFNVRLTLKNIKFLGEVEADQSSYPGLFRDSSIPPANQVDVLVYDLNNGVRIPQVDINNNTNYTINYREGLVTFSDTFGAANASGNFRFFYKARGDWGLSIQKAASVYKRRVAAANNDHEANIDFAQYYLGNGTLGSPTRMYFCLMDAGKTIGVREFWYNQAANGSGTAIRVTNESYRINSDPSLFETLNIPGVGARILTWIDIKEKHSDAAIWDAVPAGTPVIGVQGQSFRTRVIWNDGGTVEQTAAGNLARIRWKKIDLDTLLTRTPN